MDTDRHEFGDALRGPTEPGLGAIESASSRSENSLNIDDAESQKPFKIEEIYGTTRSKIERNEHNIVIGISLGNGFFVQKRENINEPNIRAYINWAISNTRERVGILIVDQIEGINIAAMSRRSNGKARYRKDQATEMALKSGKTVADQVKRMRDSIVLEDAEKLDIFNWKDVQEESNKHDNNFHFIENYFKEENEFTKDVKNIATSFVKHARKGKGEDINKEIDNERLTELAYYFLYEFAILVGGVEYGRKLGKPKIFDLLPYPIMTEVQKLIIDIQNGEKYADLRTNLIIRGKLSAISLNNF